MFKRVKTKAGYLHYYNEPTDIIDPDENNFIKDNEMKKFAWPVFILVLVLILGTGLTGCETMKSVGKTVAETVVRNVCN